MTRSRQHAFASARSLLAAGSLLVPGALVWAVPVAAQQPSPVQQPDDKAAASTPSRENCTDCPGAGSARPDSSTVTTRDGKTTVPESLMRDQADFRLI